MAFAHNVDPALEDNEANRDLILNPPPLDFENLQKVGDLVGVDGDVVVGGGAHGAQWVKIPKKVHFEKYKNTFFDILKSAKTHFLIFQK